MGTPNVMGDLADLFRHNEFLSVCMNIMENNNFKEMCLCLFSPDITNNQWEIKLEINNLLTTYLLTYQH